MSYASANVQPSGGAVPHVDANFTTDPDKSRKERVRGRVHYAEDHAKTWYRQVSDRIWVPGLAGGVLGVINVGLIGWAGYGFYTTPAYRRDYRVIGGTAAAAFALITAEGALAESYLSTDEGQAELQRAEQEGSVLYRHAKEVVLRPGVFGGLLGALNVGILGTLGYFSYLHWDEPVWDRRYVAALTAGLLTFFAGEGLVAESYREREFPKRR